jgi:hypothetical protein
LEEDPKGIGRIPSVNADTIWKCNSEQRHKLFSVSVILRRNKRPLKVMIVKNGLQAEETN